MRVRDFASFSLTIVTFNIIYCAAEIHVYRYVKFDKNNFLIPSDDEDYQYFPLHQSHSFFKPPSTTASSISTTRFPLNIRPSSESSRNEIVRQSSTTQEYSMKNPETTNPSANAQLRATTTTTATQRTTTTTQSIATEDVIVQSASQVSDEIPIKMDETPSAEAFLTYGNTEETLPLGLSKDNTVRDIVISPQMVRSGSDFNNVVLVCNASFPVEWVYEGIGAPMMYTTHIRTFRDFFDPSTYSHSSILVLVQERLDERQTGTYKCVEIQKDRNTWTGFHLFFKGEFGFPSLQNVVIQPQSTDATLIFPCPSTDPSGTVGLYQLSSLSNATRTTAKRRSPFVYDPRVGFSVKLSEMSNPYGTYACKFNELESDWKIEIVPPKYKEVETFPNATMIKMDNLADHSYICKAKEPIQIMLPNTADFGKVEYEENFTDPYPFKATLKITQELPLFSIANYFKVNCQSSKTRRILHSWEYSNFGKEEINVRYDKKHKRLLCCAKSGLTPIHEMAKCETVTDCNIKKSCFNSGRCDYAFPPKFVDAPRGCTAIEFMGDFPSHVMKCSVGQISQILMVTSNIANDNLIIYDGNVPSTEEILKIVVLKLQANNWVEVQCIASIFYFSSNIIFAFEKADGSLEFADEALINNVNSYGPTLKAHLDLDGTKRIICFAPLIRSSDWRNVTLNATGKKSCHFSQGLYFCDNLPQKKAWASHKGYARQLKLMLDSNSKNIY